MDKHFDIAGLRFDRESALRRWIVIALQQCNRVLPLRRAYRLAVS